MTVDRLTQLVRQQVGLGRFLALGGPRDGTWITERAAEAVLRRAVVRDVPGVRLDGVRIGLADPEGVTGEPVVPAPPGAVPPGVLRLTAEFAATAGRPVPVTASRLREVLAEVVVERIGLAVVEVDLRVVELLDAEPVPVAEPAPGEPAADEPAGPGDPETDRVAAAAVAVAGVRRLTGVLGRSVHLTEQRCGTGPSRRHARVDLAVAADARPLDVARRVRSAVTESLPDHPTVAVLITAVD